MSLAESYKRLAASAYTPGRGHPVQVPDSPALSLSPTGTVMSNTRVWLITGCSTGFGRELARQALERGDRVVLTARNKAQLDDLAAAHPDAALAVALDVTDGAMIADAVAAAEARFGRIDVLVNNAGYGYFSAIEEGEDA